MNEPECKVVDMTPALAQEMMQANTHNRLLRRAYVRRLAEAMARGEWTMNGEPIQVAYDGTLLNGQHRLQAVVESGVTIPVLVVSGLPLETLRTVDSGARRTLSDVLALRGEIDTTNLGAALGLLHRHRGGTRMDQSGRTAPTVQEALALLNREPSLREAVRLARTTHRRNHMRLSVMAVLTHLFNEVEPEAGTRFFEELCTVDEVPGSPVRALQSILARDRVDRTYRLPAYSLCAMTVKAFNAWNDGTQISVLSFRPGGQSPEPFPEIRQTLSAVH